MHVGPGEDLASIENGYEGCNLTEDVYMDGVFLDKVMSLDELEAGRYFFDYAADGIYLPDETRRANRPRLAPSRGRSSRLRHELIVAAKTARTSPPQTSRSGGQVRISSRTPYRSYPVGGASNRARLAAHPPRNAQSLLVRR